MMPKQHGGLGIRNTRLVNFSLLSKLAWRYLTSEGALWRTLLDVKYLRKTCFWDATKPYYCSSLWDGVLKCREELKKKTCWVLGRGTHINIWEDPWVITLPGFCVTGLDSAHHGQLKWVRELLIHNTFQWNVNLLVDVFNPIELQEIMKLHPCDNDDKLTWTALDSGIFSCKSMYHHLSQLQPPTVEASFADPEPSLVVPGAHLPSTSPGGLGAVSTGVCSGVAAMTTGVCSGEAAVITGECSGEAAEATGECRASSSGSGAELNLVGSGRRVPSSRANLLHPGGVIPGPGMSSTVAEGEFRWSRFWQLKRVAPRALLFVWRALIGGIAAGIVIKRRI